MIGQRLECMSAWFEDVRKREDRTGTKGHYVHYVVSDLCALENSL